MNSFGSPNSLMILSPEPQTIDSHYKTNFKHTLRNKQNNIAIEGFKLNTELYPNSANAFDSLAEGYFSDAQYELSKVFRAEFRK